MFCIKLNVMFSLQDNVFFQVRDLTYMKIKKTDQNCQEEILFSLILSYYFPICFFGMNSLEPQNVLLASNLYFVLQKASSGFGGVVFYC